MDHRLCACGSAAQWRKGFRSATTFLPIIHSTKLWCCCVSNRSQDVHVFLYFTLNRSGLHFQGVLSWLPIHACFTHPSNYNPPCPSPVITVSLEGKKKKAFQPIALQTADYSKSEIKVTRETGGCNEGRWVEALRSQDIWSVPLILMNLIQSMLDKTSLRQ